MPDASSDTLKNLSVLLFDLDGTLADTIELIIFCFRETLRILELPPRSDGQILSEIGRPLHLQARDIDRGRADEIFSLYQNLYSQHHDEMVREFPGIRESLAGLRERGYRLGVVTSKRDFSALPDLAFFRLDGFFEVVITADDTTLHKPHPEPVLEALDRLATVPAQATFIGDSPYDLRCARAAGVLAGAVAWGPFARETLEAERPDYWIPDPPALLTLFPGI
ncbi:MAG: HAD-IA family hydrolase [Actinomycetota bacterium]